MSHSHLVIRHLVKQIEGFAARPPQRRELPPWMQQFVTDVAELFEPFRGVARPGFECHWGEDRWEVSLFLGETEVVGGPQDGERLPVNFRFDVQGLPARFEQLDALRWNALPDCGADRGSGLALSFLVAEGRVSGQPVTLQVHAAPPETSGPGLRQLADGTSSPA